MYNYCLISNFYVQRLKVGINWIGPKENTKIESFKSIKAAIVINKKNNESAVLFNLCHSGKIYINGELVKIFKTIKLSDIITFEPFNHTNERLMLSMDDKTVQNFFFFKFFA